ncbi:MAG: hypothetical protein P4L22_06955 [Candidatus Babeliales bacterium]|nr:hypothetical protein [Candidatus Babeliales bacterium]
MKNIKNKILLLILAILAPACSNKKKVVNLNNNKKTNWSYDIGIEGIECKLCAYKAVKRLEKIPDVSSVKMICTPNFRECHADLEYNNIGNNINIQAIKDVIELEGFEVKYISGNFIGIFDDKLEKFNLVDKDINVKFKNPNGNNFNIKANHKITVYAKLIFQKKLNEIWMTIN